MRRPPTAAPQPPARQAGSALIEMALVAVLLLFIAAALIQFGRAVWYYEALHRGARDAARYLSRVPLAERQSARSGPMALHARGMVGSAMAAAGAPAPNVVIVSCEPTPFCAGAATPTAVSIYATSQVLDPGWLWMYEMTDGAAYPQINLSVRLVVPYVGG